MFGAGLFRFGTSNPYGNVSGPGSSADNEIALFDGGSGQVLQNSDIILDNSLLTVPRVLTVKNEDGTIEVVESKYSFIKTSSDISPAIPYKTYLVDSSGGIVTISLPTVTAGDKRWYRVVLNTDGNHCKINSVGVSKFNYAGQSVDEIEIPTIQASLLLKANGVDGYEVITDTRPYLRVIPVTANFDLSSGFESGGAYIGNLSDGEAVIVTIQEPLDSHVGFYAKFILHSGVNATYRIKTASGSFDETILNTNKGFELAVIVDDAGDAHHAISQDSRPSSSNVEVNFYPTTDPSVLVPAYINLDTLKPPSSVAITDAITETNPLTPQSLALAINDNKALIGSLQETAINTFASFKLTSPFNRNVKVKFKYYQYDYLLDTLGPVIEETGYSGWISNSADFEQFFIQGTLPALDWATADESSNQTLVIELLAYKSGGGGDNPTLSNQISVSRNTIDVPVSSINHATLGGVVSAGPGIPDGHIDSQVPLEIPQFTTTERDLLSMGANNKAIIFNTTTAQLEVWNGTAWVAV